MSWNGDTETRVWRFFEVTDGVGSRALLGEVKRTEFETVLVVEGGRARGLGRVVAEAVDGWGRLLRVTGEVGVEREVVRAVVKGECDGEGMVGGEKVLGEGKGKGNGGSRWEEYGILKFWKGVKDL